MTETDAPGCATRARWGRWVRLATVLGSAMAGIDATAVGIALPATCREFHASLLCAVAPDTGVLIAAQGDRLRALRTLHPGMFHHQDGLILVVDKADVASSRPADHRISQTTPSKTNSDSNAMRSLIAYDH